MNIYQIIVGCKTFYGVFKRSFCPQDAHKPVSFCPFCPLRPPRIIAVALCLHQERLTSKNYKIISKIKRYLSVLLL
jgi:hypothetical protein